jgi:TetR/AcrR family transcriptional regulator
MSTMTSVTPAAEADTTHDTGRMPAAERRALILASARDLFGQRGYNGTTTDQIAQAAGISQPYVVRMFGGKEKLFLEVLAGSLTTLLDAFRTAIVEQNAAGGTRDQLTEALGGAFVDLVTTRGLHTVLMQAFVSGSEPEIGRQARTGFLEIFRLLRDEAHFTDAEIQSFLGTGMLFSILLGIELPSIYGTDPDATQLMEAAFGDKCRVVIETMGPDA